MKRTLITCAAVAAAFGFAAGAFAQEAVTWIGAASSHRSVERYDFSIGVTAAQQPRRPLRVEENREVLNVPSHYGSLAGVVGEGNETVLWYRDEQGTMRNVVVRDGAVKSLEIRSVPSARLETEQREEKR